MHISLIPIGSRGDVQPFVALGLALKSAGHAVRVATHARFADFVRSFNLDYLQIGGDPQQILTDLEPRMTSRNPFESVPAILEVLSQLITPTLAGVVSAFAGSDLVIASYPALFAALDLSEQQRVPLVLASLYPVSPTQHASNLLFSPLPQWLPSSFQRAYHRFSHRAGEDLIFRMVSGKVNAARAAQFGWPPCPEPPIRTVHKRRLPILYAFDRTLIPEPPDWPDHVHITGFWFLDSEPHWQPPAELSAFLDAGPPPLYAGFGSLAGAQADAAMQKLTMALVRRRQRAILSCRVAPGIGGPLPDHILRIGTVPYSWLFPRLAGVIHHGGVGTVADALRAGIPMGIITYSVEQAFWARAAHRLGITPKALSARSLSAHALDELVEKVATDPDLRASAKAQRPVVCAEPGVAQAVKLIESWLPRR
jgi:UDP:flavonoid glycosyltransferase YjiC (YdhE family)